MGEQQLDSRQSAIDEVVTAWPDVKAKKVFGRRGYVRSGTMFAFLLDGGVSVRTFTAEQSDALYSRDGVEPFVYRPGMEMSAWPVLPLRTDEELADALTAVRTAYESAD